MPPNVLRFDLQDEAARPRLVERSSLASFCQVETWVRCVPDGRRLIPGAPSQEAAWTLVLGDPGAPELHS